MRVNSLSSRAARTMLVTTPSKTFNFSSNEDDGPRGLKRTHEVPTDRLTMHVEVYNRGSCCGLRPCLHRTRRACARFSNNKWFKGTIYVAILVNSLLISFDDPAAPPEKRQVLQVGAKLLSNSVAGRCLIAWRLLS